MGNLISQPALLLLTENADIFKSVFSLANSSNQCALAEGVEVFGETFLSTPGLNVGEYLVFRIPSERISELCCGRSFATCH